MIRLFLLLPLLVGCNGLTNRQIQEYTNDCDDTIVTRRHVYTDEIMEMDCVKEKNDVEN